MMKTTPQVYLWKTNGTGVVDHAAIMTDTYYFSFWPKRYMRTLDPKIRASPTFEEPASIVFSPLFDTHIQGAEPDEVLNIRNIDDAAINKWYMDMLDFNNIPTQSVTLEAATEYLDIMNRISENRFGEGYYADYVANLSKDLPRTTYSLAGHIMFHKPPIIPLTSMLFERHHVFFHYPQNSITLTYNLIETADRESSHLPFRVEHRLSTSDYKFYCHLFTAQEFQNIFNEHYSRPRPSRRRGAEASRPV